MSYRNDEEREERDEGFDLFGVFTHLAAAGLGFAAGNAVGSRRKHRELERKIEALEQDIVYDTHPSTW